MQYKPWNGADFIIVNIAELWAHGTKPNSAITSTNCLMPETLSECVTEDIAVLSGLLKAPVGKPWNNSSSCTGSHTFNNEMAFSLWIANVWIKYERVCALNVNWKE